MADNIKIKINGMQSLMKKIKRQPDELELEMRDTMMDAATLVQQDVIRSIRNEPKSGRFYTRNKLRYQASAPGEPPAEASGTLVRQIVVKKSNRKLAPQTRLVAPGIYRFLENGTRQMAARPAFGPAMQRNMPKIETMVKRRSQAVIKKTAKR